MNRMTRFAPSSPRSVRYADAELAAAFAGQRFLLFDGAMGTMIQAAGLEVGHSPELLCLTDPDAITAIHAQYVQAGSQVISSNTFGASARKLEGRAGVAEVFHAAIRCARDAGARYVAADIGPLGALLEPMGTLSFDDAYDLFAEQMDAALAAGADLILIETMTDLLEVKAAVLAAKERTDLPIVASMTFGEDGRTFLGTDPATAAIALSALGVQAVGMNCSLGPREVAGLVGGLLDHAPCPVIVQANAGLPLMVDGATVFPVGPQEYVEDIRPVLEAGVSLIGGCCGTDPSYIRGLAELLDEMALPAPRAAVSAEGVTSAQRSVVLGRGHVAVIGERINPTGRKRLKQALRAHDFDYVLGEAMSQADAGADILDVNAGLPEIDEVEVLEGLCGSIQAVCPLPLQIDSADPVALEAAVRRYAGKPIINSVNGKRESLDAVVPIAAHYGCALVGLTLDEQGIPATAEGRFAVAERIVSEAGAAGIAPGDIYIDCLAMAVSTDQTQGAEILRAIRMVKEKLGVRTVLGVSNISFGLPSRDLVNATFLSAAFAAGLDAAIVNPLSQPVKGAIDAWRVLSGQDVSAREFIGCHALDVPSVPSPAVPAAAASSANSVAATASASASSESAAGRLLSSVLSGLRAEAASATSELLDSLDAMEVINAHLIPALDEVGARFESGRIFLPQLLASAEAAKAGFDVVRTASSGCAIEGKGRIALATVKGDIHDIGKNIVKMLLENYGYEVFDLGRDVDSQAVLDCVRANSIALVGLSALMTTTVKGMEETIDLLRREAPDVRVFVGGAVLTEEYARMVGADFYAKDAAESARIAAEVLG